MTEMLSRNIGWNDPEKQQEFDKQVHEHKMENLRNLSHLIRARNKKKVSESELQEKFKWWINEEKSNSFLVKKGLRNVSADWIFPMLNFTEDKEKIVKTILEKVDWKFDSPLHLSETIASFLRENLDYDYFQIVASMQKMTENLHEMGDKKIKILSSMGVRISKKEKEHLKKGNWNVLEKVIARNFHNNLGNLTIPNNLKPIMTSNIKKDIQIAKSLEKPPFFIKGLESMLDKLSGDESKLIKFVQKNYEKQPRFRAYLSNLYLISAGEDWWTSVNYWVNEINDLLNGGVGVCRQFSVAMKKIYNEISPKFFPYSEMMYVVNPINNHGYNKLLYREDDPQNSKISPEMKEQYLDMTRYILEEKPLHLKRNEAWPAKPEIYVDNASPNSKSQRKRLV